MHYTTLSQLLGVRMPDRGKVKCYLVVSLAEWFYFKFLKLLKIHHKLVYVRASGGLYLY